jgi:hypothetical protein
LCIWHFSHSVMSMLKTRLKRWAVPASHDMLLAWYGLSICSLFIVSNLGLFSSSLWSRRCDAVTCARRLLLGANTPN